MPLGYTDYCLSLFRLSLPLGHSSKSLKRCKFWLTVTLSNAIPIHSDFINMHTIFSITWSLSSSTILPPIDFALHNVVATHGYDINFIITSECSFFISPFYVFLFMMANFSPFA